MELEAFGILSPLKFAPFW